MKSGAFIKFRKLSLFCTCLFLFMSGPVFADAEITGQVIAAGNNEVLTKIDHGVAGQSYPKSGDKVIFWVEIPSLDELVDGGTGTVSRVEDGTVFVRVENAESLLQAKAAIQASGLRTVVLNEGLTLARMVKLKQLFRPIVDSMQARDNSSCLQEQWCYSVNPVLEKSCSSFVGLCPDFAIENKYPSPWYEQSCTELWGNLKSNHWKVIGYGRPCELPLPSSIKKPVFTQQQAICIAEKSCNKGSSFAQEVCENSVLECARDPARLLPRKRASCRTDLRNLKGDIDKTTAFFYEPAQCLR